MCTPYPYPMQTEGAEKADSQALLGQLHREVKDSWQSQRETFVQKIQGYLVHLSPRVWVLTGVNTGPIPIAIISLSSLHFVSYVWVLVTTNGLLFLYLLDGSITQSWSVTVNYMYNL